MKRLLLLSMIALYTSTLGCGDNEDCVAELVDPCAVTYNIDYVCGCDNVTYVNSSEAECHQIYSYTEGECNE